MHVIFTCLIFNLYFIVKLVTGQLPPQYLVYSERETPFAEQESFTLTCTAYGERELAYTWYKNDVEFDWQATDGRVTMVPGAGSLNFIRPDVRDEAIYQCFVSNQYGVAVTDKMETRRAYLGAFPPSPPRYVSPRLGHPQTLSCVLPSSYPRGDVFWVNIGPSQVMSPVELTDRITLDHQGNLHFANIQGTDGKFDTPYSCVVSNQVVRAIQTGFDHIIQPVGSTFDTFPASILWASPSHVLALKGDEIRMKCIFSGSPTPRVDWNRIDWSGGRMRLESYGQELVITDVQERDAGEYECQAINDEMQFPISRTVSLTVESAPYWTRTMESVIAEEGEDVVVHCNTTGIPQPNTPQWFINGVHIEGLSGRNIEIGDATLTFKNVTLQDTCGVQCNVSNKHGYVYGNAFISIQREPAKIVEPLPHGQKIVQGKDYVFRCKNAGFPTPDVWWHKEGTEIKDDRFIVTEKGDLSIMDMSEEDAGNYTCFVANPYGTANSTGSLIVRSPTIIRRGPLSKIVEEYTDVHFTCLATTDPQEQEHLVITWTRGDRPFTGNQMRVFQDPRDDALHILSTITLDSGNYTCTANNGLDSDTATAELTVQGVPDPPEIQGVQCNYRDMTAGIGFRAYNPLDVTYYIIQYNITSKPNLWVEVKRVYQRYQVYTEVKIAPGNNFTFRVLAGNSIGISYPSQHSRQVCSTPPDRPAINPTNVVAEGNKPDNLIIYWTPLSVIEYNGPGLKYRIIYNQQAIIINDPTTSYYVIQLPDNTPYQEFLVTVTSQNQLGESPVPPLAVVGHSGEDVPEVAPFDVTVDSDSITESEVSLKWTHVDTSPQAVHGFFRGYKIQYGRVSEWPNLVREEDYILADASRHYLSDRVARDTGEEMEYRLEHDMPHSAIRVVVRVINKFYAGPASNLVEFTSKDGEPRPPKSVVVTDRSSSHLSLEWEPPTYPNGNLTGYIVSYRTVHGLHFGLSLPSIMIDDQSILTVNLTDLLPATQYWVSVRATTSKGPGEEYFLLHRTAVEDEVKSDNLTGTTSPHDDCDCDSSQSQPAHCDCTNTMKHIMTSSVPQISHCECTEVSGDDPSICACDNAASTQHSACVHSAAIAALFYCVGLMLLGL